MSVKKLQYAAFALALAAIVSCSKKDLPQGTRVSVLPVEKAEEQEVSLKGKTVSLPAVQNNVNWSQNGGNSEHSFGNLGGNLSFNELWRKKFGASAGKRDMLISEPVVMENTLFTLDAKAEVCAFDLSDGSLLWKAKGLDHAAKKTKLSMKGVGLAANASNLFVATGTGKVVAMDIKEGKTVWSYDAQTPIRIAPTVSAGRVYVQTIDNRLIAINATDGEELWNYEVLQEDTILLGGASPALDISQDILVAAFSSGELQAIKASTGSPLWSDVLVSNRYAAIQSSVNAVKANPVISKETIYAIGNGKTLVAIDAVSGERIWSKAISGSYQPIVSGDYLFVLSNDNFLSALDKENGSTVWSKKLPQDEKNTFALRPIMVNGYILVAMSNGKILRVNAADGNFEPTLDIGEDLSVSPIVANGKIIFSTANAEVIVYE